MSQWYEVESAQDATVAEEDEAACYKDSTAAAAAAEEDRPEHVSWEVYEANNDEAVGIEVDALMAFVAIHASYMPVFADVYIIR